jgi:hypothetical protein
MRLPDRSTLLAALTLAMLGLRSLGHAQSPDSAYARRRVARLTDEVRADSTLPDSIRRLGVHDIVDPTNTSYFRLLDDSTAGVFMRLVASSLHELPDSICGTLLGSGDGRSPDFHDILPLLDPTAVDSWAVLFAHVVHLRAAAGPGYPLAPPEQVHGATVTMLQRLGPEDQQRLMLIARTPPPSPRDACWSIQVMMDGLAAIASADLGPVVRAMFSPTTLSNPKSP